MISVEGLNHQYRAYGQWTFALEPYRKRDITKYLNTQQFAEMAAIIDPINYLERYTMPIYLVCSTGLK